MKGLARLPQFLLLLSIFSTITGVLAAKPTSFCKCTCFSNSTIIELRPIDIENDLSDGFAIRSTIDSLSGSWERDTAIEEREDTNDKQGNNKGRPLTCTDCNRKFCLDYNLPKCKGAKEEDIIATCFQRDSRKDQSVVIIFIIATGSLLVWAVARPWVQGWIEAARERRSYIPVSRGTTDQQ